MSEQQKQQSDVLAPKVEKTKDRKLRQENPAEVGGAEGPEPTRYGDWERNGRCTDF